MSCLFHSLASFVKDLATDDLRRMIADFLEKDPVLNDNMRLSEILPHEPGAPTLAAYVQNMRSPATWGGAIEIKAFCELFDAVVLVVVLRTGKVIEFQPTGPGKKGSFVFRVSWNGGHYEPLSN